MYTFRSNNTNQNQLAKWIAESRDASEYQYVYSKDYQSKVYKQHAGNDFFVLT